MSIEKMKEVWLIAPHSVAQELVPRIARLGLLHPVDSGNGARPDWAANGIERLSPDLTDLELRVQRLREILDVLLNYNKRSEDILAKFIPTPLEVTAAEVEQAIRNLKESELHEKTLRLERERSKIAGERDKARENLNSLRALSGLRVMILGQADQKRTAGYAALVSRQKFAALKENLPDEFALAEAAVAGKELLIQAAAPVAEREKLLALLHQNTALVLEPPAETMTADEYMQVRRGQYEALAQQHDNLAGELKTLADANRRHVEMALGYWEERLSIARAQNLMARSRRVAIMKGYVRERNLADFEQKLKRDLPGVALVARDPEPESAVPVALKNPRFFAPAQFLVSMFGVPSYFTLDPTPVIFFSFLIFFGICFGDVIYGLGLIALGWALTRRYRAYTNLRHFFQLLAYAGVTTTIIGLLTGAWGSDLVTNYIGGPLARVVKFFAVMDPLDAALIALVMALGLGMLNQFIGIMMLMAKNIRKGDVKSAIFDGGFWLLALPGFVIVATQLFVKLPGKLQIVGWSLLGVGALGLILTQGRNEKSLIGKAAVGVISLYGIVGSYGITAFIGDTLSYSRLLALGLTTGIVGLAFNIIAKMVGGVPYGIGLVLFILVVLLGHLLNFGLSLMGGFVHSARLTFVEFFGRFYESGVQAFSPLGTWRGRIRVMDRDTVWTEE